MSGKPFRETVDELVHGVQKPHDVTSCLIVSINAIAHNVFGDELYTHKRRNILRMQYFLILANEHNTWVSQATH